MTLETHLPGFTFGLKSFFGHISSCDLAVSLAVNWYLTLPRVVGQKRAFNPVQQYSGSEHYLFIKAIIQADIENLAQLCLGQFPRHIFSIFLTHECIRS